MVSLFFSFFLFFRTYGTGHELEGFAYSRKPDIGPGLERVDRSGRDSDRVGVKGHGRPHVAGGTTLGGARVDRVEVSILRGGHVANREFVEGVAEGAVDSVIKSVHFDEF